MTDFGEFSINKILVADGELKEMIVECVGNKLNPTNDEVTMEMAIGVIAEEFPELLLTVAEENYLRGYERALDDVNTFRAPEANNGTK